MTRSGTTVLFTITRRTRLPCSGIFASLLSTAASVVLGTTKAGLAITHSIGCAVNEFDL
jgi:hypothetical protein